MSPARLTAKRLEQPLPQREIGHVQAEPESLAVRGRYVVHQLRESLTLLPNEIAVGLHPVNVMSATICVIGAINSS